MTREEHPFLEGLEAGRPYAAWLDTLSADERVHVWFKEYRRIVAALRDNRAVQARLRQRLAVRLREAGYHPRSDGTWVQDADR